MRSWPWLAAPVTARDLDEAYLANVLFDAHHDDPEFGHRLLADEAARTGLRACDRRPPLLHGIGRRLRRMRRRFRGHPHRPVGLHP